ncbi:MAG: DUF1573 domain-containing protein [Bacteroidales bacterium]|nr:DUF1573 domain-containing protein [Bacteroidales bacterium]
MMRGSLLLVATMALLLAACGGKKDNVGLDLIHNTQTVDGKGSGENMPSIRFDRDVHDFGRLTANENVSYSFHFVNAGKADLLIGGCAATCGCTVADYPRERIAPGKDGYVKVSFKSAGMSGRQVKEVTVSTNGDPSRVKLRIMAEVGI